MRGTPEPRLVVGQPVGIIPAHAGNTANTLIKGASARDHPRACGEHWWSGKGVARQVGSSPRMRGTPQRLYAAGSTAGIIPAHAGNTCRGAQAGSRHGDHPRACGEHMITAVRCVLPSGSSPRMRGTLRHSRPHHLQPGIIPAHAGNTVSLDRVPNVYRDHPRACGEHERLIAFRILTKGSSPRMRGTRPLSFLTRRLAGIIPAHAGNTKIHRYSPVLQWDHPRACGEHMRWLLLKVPGQGSSPRMRGTRRRSRRVRGVVGIIPAHAGNTTLIVRLIQCMRDHPRACGEHVSSVVSMVCMEGSSPRMRGTPGLRRTE